MGHIANKDVEKTYLAASTFQSLFLTLSIPLGITLLNVVMFMVSGESTRAIAMESGSLFLSYFAGTASSFLLFFVIVYVLRKQIT